MTSEATLPFDVEIARYIANAPICAIPMTQAQFFDFCQLNRSYHFERNAKGDLFVIPLSGGEAGRRILSAGAQLYNWATKEAKGDAFDSSTGFILPNGANRSPDASWILKSRLATRAAEQLKKFLPLCPDFLIELLSPSDSLSETQKKMDEYIANDARLGWLIDPRNKQVHVYRPGSPVDILDNPTRVSGDPELPGFVLDLNPIWRAS